MIKISNHKAPPGTGFYCLVNRLGEVPVINSEEARLYGSLMEYEDFCKIVDAVRKSITKVAKLPPGLASFAIPFYRELPFNTTPDELANLLKHLSKGPRPIADVLKDYLEIAKNNPKVHHMPLRETVAILLAKYTRGEVEKRIEGLGKIGYIGGRHGASFLAQLLSENVTEITLLQQKPLQPKEDESIIIIHVQSGIIEGDLTRENIIKAIKLLQDLLARKNPEQ